MGNLLINSINYLNITCPWCGYEMANVPKPSAAVSVSGVISDTFFRPSTRKYSTNPLTPASLSWAKILRNIVVPIGVDCN